MVLRSPAAGGSSHGLLHFATSGSPSSRTAPGMSSSPASSTLGGWAIPAAAHTPASPALSARSPGSPGGWAGSR
ncbi:hypothetical protein [Streptomyces clavuligerus]|uniref:hypothetical protein n=1 Tax=Streptomyces clavuligerus TaxID=1901 RepID=UPI0018D19B01|nr:hypothetical protein [Streptomyces clavuligerus]